MRYARFGFVFIGIVLCALVRASHGYEPSVDDLAAVLWRYNETAPEPLPIPSRALLADIANGKTIDLRERTRSADDASESQDQIRVVGYQFVPRPRLLVWLATLNVDAGHSPRLIEHLVDGDDAGGSVWYQHLDTPWPVRDRHWVIRNTKSVSLAAATRGLVWQHGWRLADRGQAIADDLLLNDRIVGLDEKDIKRAIYLHTNRGAWTMFAIGDNATLVVAHTTAEMGGWIPDSWVAGFVSRQLGHVLKNLKTRADSIGRDYTGDYLIFGGDGQPITTQMAREASRLHRLQIGAERVVRESDHSD